MTLDETITLLKFNNKHIADLKNDDLQQIAEWLEELKVLSLEHKMPKTNEAIARHVGYETGYNKAIDDFVNACKDNVLCKTFGLRENDIEQIAEQLKAGVTND